MEITGVEREVWSESDSDRFTKYGDALVPNRFLQMEIIANLIPQSKETTKIVDLCAGEGLLEKVILSKIENASILVLDGSCSMLEKAKINLEEYKNKVEFKEFRLEEDNWRNLSKVDAVVSSLAIHHLNEVQKQDLFSYIYSILNPKGAFIIADVIKAQSELTKSLHALLWDKVAYNQSIEQFGTTEAFDYFNKIHWNMFSDPEPDEVDKPSGIYEQLKWLETAGFSDIEVFWLNAGHAIYGGYKK